MPSGNGTGNIAHYTRALMRELAEHGEASLLVDEVTGYGLSDSKARNRLYLAARYLGVRVTTQRIGDRVHGTVIADDVGLATEARAVLG